MSDNAKKEAPEYLREARLKDSDPKSTILAGNNRTP